MSDPLLSLSRNRMAKKIVKNLGLPIPMPEPLKRASTPLQAQELADMKVSVGGGELCEKIKTTLESVGAISVEEVSTETKLNGLVFDATSTTSIEGLGGLYEFLKPRVTQLQSGSKVLLVGRTPNSGAGVEADVVSEALIGFCKSLAKELGKKGGTCQYLRTELGAGVDRALSLPIRFFLSPRSSFISGQFLNLTQAPMVPEALPIHQPLAGKTALVTGAAAGIGAQIAKRLSQEGAKVLGLDRPQEKQALESSMSEIGGSALAVDLSDTDATKKIIESVQDRCQTLDILVNNAGITRDKTFARMPRDIWDMTLAINCTIPVRLTEAMLAKGLIRANGRILFMSSIAGIGGNFGQTNYSSAKAGLIGYARSKASSLATRGITVNALAPGFIETRMTKAIPFAVREVARRLNALNQAGLPLDVAEAAVFLASPGAYAVTGNVLRVCGLNLIGA